MSLFTPDFGLLFWMALAFGIVLAVLAKWGFPVIVKAVNDRKTYIDKSLQNAHEANERLVNIKAETDMLVAQAQVEKQTILKDAVQQKQRILAEAQEQVNELTRKQMEQAKADIEEQRQQSLHQIRKETADLAIEMAKKVMQSELRDETAQRQSIENQLEGLKEG
ncbi:MAG: F0F1 ATP synthase subunit B [Bacteroidaceae bacterium]|nr:F0F1 ATP synthase subunit B [Bacteroidaceae bacterium]MBQ2341461.1 F0F1 ATP synthase subunit B [Bacteroidaceae bacterium]MBQ6051297.1 F0F1 ATP synthase subunit B [Bacteroidaceae bacterium]MBR3547193.1 F0F1 ATP synthase subunit B [Bacteroidaceae bacterium]MBR6048479.1 F0F1 ATP synthase subunit B [Bacteroidaceae bacterium]